MSKDFENLLENINNSNDFQADISSMNLFDGIKFAVKTSAYLLSDYPDKKIKLHSQDEIKKLSETFAFSNLTFI